MKKSMKTHKLVKFQKSKTKGKKYDAIVENKKTGKQYRIPFGATGYEQFKDSTGLGLYSHKNHGDKERRRNYRARHKVFLRKGYFTPAYFSWKYLW